MTADIFNIIIETPKGSAVKYKYNEEHDRFILHKMLPAGMVFPFDFGFIPGTKGEDGDPLDALIVSAFESFPGCMMQCRLLGAIKAEQTEKAGQSIRNDRFFFAPVVTGDAMTTDQYQVLLRSILTDMEAFFINYNRQQGKEFRPLGFMEVKEAAREIKKFTK